MSKKVKEWISGARFRNSLVLPQLDSRYRTTLKRNKNILGIRVPMIGTR